VHAGSPKPRPSSWAWFVGEEKAPGGTPAALSPTPSVRRRREMHVRMYVGERERTREGEK
jgi:hypothetical protein